MDKLSPTQWLIQQEGRPPPANFPPSNFAEDTF